MRTRAVNGFTESQVKAALRGENRAPELRTRFELLDIDNQLIREVKNIQLDGSEITHNSFAEIKGTAKFRTIESDIILDSYPDLVIDDGAEFYLRMGEASGNLNDSSGNGRTFTANGTPTYQQPSLLANATDNGAILFNGTNAYFSIADAAWMDVTTAVSWEAWINTTATTDQAIIARSDGNTTNSAFVFYLENGVLALALVASGAFAFYISAANVNDGLPHHVCATFDGANIKLYVDSVRVLKTARTAAVNNGNLAIRIGANNVTGDLFNGMIDEAAFYGRALSATEVRDHYQSGSGELSEIDYYRDRVKPYVAIKMDTNGTDGTPWAEWPLGIYLLEAPSRVSEFSIQRDVDGFDQTIILANSRVQAVYTVASGTNVVTAISSALTTAGITMTSLTPTTHTMPAARDWPIGTSYLRIVNDLLDSISYRAIHFDADGSAIGEPYVLPSERTSEYTFATDGDSVILEGVESLEQIADVPNRVVMVLVGPDVATKTSTQTNTKVSSITSTVRRGITIVHYEEVPDAADQTALDNMAKRRLTELSEVLQYITFKLGVLHPFFDDLDKITFRHTGISNALDIDADFIVAEWRLELTEKGDMYVRARRSVNVI
jgi:hypothetical protein